MKTENNRGEKIIENLKITSSSSVIPNEETTPTFRKKGLTDTPNNELSDEEWLKAKHRILDDRFGIRSLI